MNWLEKFKDKVELVPETVLRELIGEAKERNKEFNAWVVPFLAPKVEAAVNKEWRIEIGVSHIFFIKGLTRVMISGTIEKDGKKWIHLSVSHPKALPHHTTLKFCKMFFIGDELTAYQVFPPKAEYVNDNTFVLHLWACLDGAVTPDFRKVDTLNGGIVSI